MLAKRCIIFCAVSITCTTDAALLFFNHSYRERIHALVPNANPQWNFESRRLDSVARPSAMRRPAAVVSGSNGERHVAAAFIAKSSQNEKLLFTWAWKSTPERESLVKLTFKNDNGGTLMTLIREQFIYEAPRNRHQSGWNGAMEKLEKYLAA